MAVYRITDDRLQPLQETSFESAKIKEREDLQRLLRDQPEVLEEGLFILSEEYGDWVESSRRIDLLALDAKRRLVVIELKRSDDDSMMDLQAVRYAALVANMTLAQAIEAHRHYLDIRGIRENPEFRVLNHLGGDDENIHIDSAKPRIILASANFSKELTTSVLWLNDVGLDVTCVKLQPCKMDDSTIFVDSSQVIPMPEAADYMIRLRDREAERQESSQVSQSPGGDAFSAHIEEVSRPVEKRNLERMHKLATDLEREGLASLVTREGARPTLHVRIPGPDSNLFVIHKHGNYCNLIFNQGNLERYAPKAKKRLDKMLDIRYRYHGNNELPKGLEKALREAYTEANATRES